MFEPQFPTVPTTGPGTLGAQSWASVLPTISRSPRWSAVWRSTGAASAWPAKAVISSGSTQCVRDVAPRVEFVDMVGSPEDAGGGDG
ncbi:hypothetical protein [Myxococcus faecalis]|uniref:hypothetical protein n=1 Tax=Myxococcus faecalis TaxID=3115646 RepID=UPI003CF3ADF3